MAKGKDTTFENFECAMRSLKPIVKQMRHGITFTLPDARVVMIMAEADWYVAAINYPNGEQRISERKFSLKDGASLSQFARNFDKPPSET